MATPIAVLIYRKKSQTVNAGQVIIRIEENEVVGELAEKVAEKLLKLSPTLTASDIIIWQPTAMLKASKDLVSRLEEHDYEMDQFCTNLTDDHSTDPILPLITATKSGRSASRTALVAEVTLPQPVAVVAQNAAADDQEDEEDFIAELKKEYKRAVDVGRTTGTPSANTKSTGYNERQKDAPIVDGRYPRNHGPNVAPPIELYHPTFAKFLANINKTDLEVPTDVVQKTAELMEATSQIATSEAQREHITRRLLADILISGVTQGVNHDRTSANHIILVTRTTEPAEVAAILIVEEKHELGFSGDPSVQGPLSYMAFWVDVNHERLRDLSCCPCFVIGIAGPWIVIMGCVFTSGVIAQRLTEYFWLGHSRVIDDAIALHLARVFHSLGLAISELRQEYLGLSSDVDKILRFFPFINSYTTATDRTVEFRYLKPLESGKACVTFLAVELLPKAKANAAAEHEGEDMQEEFEDGQQIVVKFVERYGAEAHRLLAGQGLAPKLFYCGPISNDPNFCYGQRLMVVMEHIEGKTIFEYAKQIAKPVCARISEAVRLLHENLMVHGDLRRPNVMIQDGAGKPERRVKIIDFDWAGLEGKVRYPLHLSRAAGWAKGVKDYELIKYEHDTKMVELL